MLTTNTAKFENMTENVKLEPRGAVAGKIRCRRPALETLWEAVIRDGKWHESDE